MVGVRTGDKGIDKHGKRKANFEPGVDLRAKVTILAEGARGSLTKTVVSKLKLDAGKQSPQVYAIGVKELWEVPAGRLAKGAVFPHARLPARQAHVRRRLRLRAHRDAHLGGPGRRARLPRSVPRSARAVRRSSRSTRWSSALLEGGNMVRYGARTISEGGWYSVPRPYGDGLLIVGEAAGFLNGMRLKGIHLGLKTGMLAAETALEALVAGGHVRGDSSAPSNGKVEQSWVKKELWKVRNFHAGLQARALARARQQRPADVQRRPRPRRSHGAGRRATPRSRPCSEALRRRHQPRLVSCAAKPDGKLTFDRLTDVYHSGTKHEEDQPTHLHVADTNICETRCTESTATPASASAPPPSTRWCRRTAHRAERLQINFSNCVHCKTCDVMDPYQIITWVTPEGGGGPRYDDL